MTGEITLRGRVLPIGGLKEKALAAYRAGIRTIIIPYENKADIDDIPKDIAKQLTFIPVQEANEVFDIALI
jgi:ATP-dependent Lon protease